MKRYAVIVSAALLSGVLIPQANASASAETVSVLQKAPPDDVKRAFPAAPAEPQALLDDLRRAKAAGDETTASDLAGRLGWKAGPGQSPVDPGGGMEKAGASSDPDPLARDVLVSNPVWSSGNPAIASTADGTLYAVDEALSGPYLDIYRSTNGGYGWTYLLSIFGTEDLNNPSIVIGEGNVNRLVVAYEEGRETASAAIRVFWYDLDTEDFGTSTVQAQAYGYLATPRICVDSPEYAYWYPYITWVRGIIGLGETYNVAFSRSFDYGDSWETPTTVAGGVPADARPDIDYGDTNLYVAYARYGGGSDYDVYYRRSTSLGGSWDSEVGLAITSNDEFEPRVAATYGGTAAVVAFSKEYTPPNTDIESYVSTDGGGTWILSYLPWNSEPERTVDLSVSPSFGRIHAVYRRGADVEYTSSAYDSPGTWQSERALNDNIADPAYGPAVVANPTRPPEAAVVWSVQAPDGNRVYFDAAYPVGNYAIVVANNDLIAAVNSLKDWKEQLGFAVSVVTVEQILEMYGSGDDAERIWSYLSDSFTDSRYALLVGDVDLLPMRALYPNGNPAYPPSDPRHHNGLAYGSDYYYAKVSTGIWDVDGDDRWGEFTDDGLDPQPDILAGRLPFDDAATVQAICNDIVAFEQATGSWKREALFAHGFYNYKGDVNASITDAAYAGEAIKSDSWNPQGWGWTTLYEQGGIGPSVFPSTSPLSQTNYRANLGWGIHGVVSALAHGNTGGMAGMRWVKDCNGNNLADLKEEWCYNWFSNWDQIGADPASGVVALIGCSTGIIWGNDPDFAESELRSRYLIRVTRDNTMIKEYLRHGASVVIASTAGSDYGNGWTGPPANGYGQTLDYLFFGELADGRRVGDAFYAAHLEYAETYGMRRGIRVFNLYGDPSLTLEDIQVPGAQNELMFASAQPATDPARTGLVTRPLTSPQTFVLPTDPLVWVETADLVDCSSVSAMLRTESGLLLAGGMATTENVTNQGVVYRSSDAGETWERVDIPGCWSVRTLVQTEGGPILAGGAADAGESVDGVIYRSTDDGATWQQRLLFPGGIVADIADVGGGTYYAGTGWGGAIYRSLDEGQNWALLTNLGAGVQVASMTSMGGDLFAALEAPAGLSPIMGSHDGVNWWPAAGLGLVESAYDVLSAAGILYAGVRESGDVGWVYRSDDAGETWYRTTEFTDPTDIRAIRALRLGPDGTILAGASTEWGPASTKVFALPPGEVSWEELGGGVDLANKVHAMVVLSGNLYIGTGDNYGNVYLVSLGIPTDVPSDDEPGGRLRLEPNRPNPFHPRTMIRYELPRELAVTLRIFDSSGRVVRRLASGGTESAGPHAVSWDGTDDAGRRLPSGVYYYRLVAGGQRLDGDMVLMK